MTEDNHMPDEIFLSQPSTRHQQDHVTICDYGIYTIPHVTSLDPGGPCFIRKDLYNAVVAERDELAEKLRKADEAFTVAQDLINSQHGTIKQLRAVAAEMKAAIDAAPCPSCSKEENDKLAVKLVDWQFSHKNKTLAAAEKAGV